MAVVKLKSNLYRAADGAVLDPLVARGVVRKATGLLTNAASDSALSTYKLISLPSHVILDPSTTFIVNNWGFATINIGTLATIAALTTVLRSAGAVLAPITATSAASGPRLWQSLGLAADPNDEIDLYVQGPAAATAAGTMPFTIGWIDNG